MKRKPQKDKSKALRHELQGVNVRLFRADVLELKALAGKQQIPWSYKLRMLVRDSLKRSKAVVS